MEIIYEAEKDKCILTIDRGLSREVYMIKSATKLPPELKLSNLTNEQMKLMTDLFRKIFNYDTFEVRLNKYNRFEIFESQYDLVLAKMSTEKTVSEALNIVLSRNLKANFYTELSSYVKHCPDLYVKHVDKNYNPDSDLTVDSVLKLTARQHIFLNLSVLKYYNKNPQFIRAFNYCYVCKDDIQSRPNWTEIKYKNNLYIVDNRFIFNKDSNSIVTDTKLQMSIRAKLGLFASI